MDDRKFTPPTEFPAEYVDSNGDKAVILGRGPHKVFPFIGHNAAGYARYWTEKGTFSRLGINGFDLHDIPKRISTEDTEMTNRKFTPPTEFPAEYVDGHGNKVTILGRSNNKHSPLIGFEHVGYARCWTEEGTCRHHDRNIDLHDIPKRIDEREDWDALQEVTAELEQAEARIEELEGKLAEATEALEGVRSFTRDLGLYADQGHTLAPALRKACDTIAEMKGEQ